MQRPTTVPIVSRPVACLNWPEAGHPNVDPPPSTSDSSSIAIGMPPDTVAPLTNRVAVTPEARRGFRAKRPRPQAPHCGCNYDCLNLSTLDHLLSQCKGRLIQVRIHVKISSGLQNPAALGDCARLFFFLSHSETHRHRLCEMEA